MALDPSWAGNPAELTPERKTWLMDYVGKRVDLALVAAVHFDYPKAIRLTLESGVERSIAWPARALLNGRGFA